MSEPLELRLRHILEEFIESNSFLASVEFVRKFVEGAEEYITQLNWFGDGFMQKFHVPGIVAPDISAFLPEFRHVGAAAKRIGWHAFEIS